ncbi:MAG: adenosine-specific kinase [archaeon]
MAVELELVSIENPETHEVILGQGNFSVKTIDDLYTIVYSAVPNAKFGIAMNEAKPKLIRVTGNDETAKALAAKAALGIAAGHIFAIFLKDAYPIQVLSAVRAHPCVAGIYCATSNPLQVIVARTGLGASVLGVVDGSAAERVETPEEKAGRREMVKTFGFMPK